MAKQREKTVTGRVLHDPVKDKLRPMFPLDLSKCRTVDELVRAMGDTAFTLHFICTSPMVNLSAMKFSLA